MTSKATGVVDTSQKCKERQFYIEYSEWLFRCPQHRIDVQDESKVRVSGMALTNIQETLCHEIVRVYIRV